MSNLREIEGDILKIEEGIICHQCNAQGVMGAGLAKAIKAKWPTVYKEYRSAFRDGGIRLGVCQVIRVKPELFVANLVGQDRYGVSARMTNYDAVRLCLKSLAKQTEKENIYIPYLMGCGLGGGDWGKVSSIIEEELGERVTIVKYGS